MIEFTANIEVSEKDWNNPLLQELLRIGTKSVVLCNDFYSFRKEILECDGDLKRCRNLIALYMLLENLTLQESINKLHKFLLKTDEEVLQIVDSLKKDKSISKETEQFVENFLALIGGNYLFSIGLKRYHGKNLKGFIPLSGNFIFSEFETIIIPDKDVDENWGFFFQYFD